MSAPIHLVLLWHMHQPDYRLPDTPGRAAMPWTRLHAAKDYVDIVELLGRRPDVRMAVNVVPVLLDQLDDIAAGSVDPLVDAARAAAAGRTSLEEREFLLRSARTLPYGRMLPVSRRLPALCAANEHSPGDLRDLAMLLHLAWTGPLLRRETTVAAWIERDGGFSEDDIERLLSRIAARAGETADAWARVAASGAIEFSTTPYNHPILPLLCDLQAAEEARPGCSVEGITYRRPEDAVRQVREGVERAGAAFKHPVVGMWPSEGSVSEDALRAVREGAPQLRWLATDRAILHKSRGHVDDADCLRPWRVRGQGPAVFFRDTELSDRIGFVYANMPTDEAVADFLAGVRRKAGSADGTATVCVFLDGENCWEHYEAGGEPFLRALVDAIADAPDIEALTPSEALEAADGDGRTGSLDRLLPGSWIRGDLDTWSGHPEKNAAWRRLAAAADALEAARAAGAPGVEEAHERLLKAEGSDWFWWLGDDHPTPWKREFDALFRAHVASVYRALGSDPPPDTTELASAGGAPAPVLPDAPFAPIVAAFDAEDRSHFGWYGAARIAPGNRDGSMHAGTEAPVRELQYGWQGGWLRLRLLPRRGRLDTLLGEGRITVELDGREVRSETRCGAVLQARVDPGEAERLQIVLRPADGAVIRVPQSGPVRVRRLPEEGPAWTA